VLMAAGGFGLASLDQSVAILADTCEDVQLLAVAGRNEKLKAALEKVAASRPGKIMAFGFVNNMHELMAASDLAVTKSGGLTSSECMALGLPMIVVKPIPGQEERNADYLLENGVAVRANSGAHLVYKLRQLLGDPERLARMREAARRVSRPRAAYDVCEKVISEM
jgi:processive 1,2-diacylglycerol beta-glucosyltransferase